MTNDLRHDLAKNRDTWKLTCATLLHVKIKWSLEDSMSYSECLASSYFDDPDFYDEDGLPISPEDAISEDMQHWED